MSNEQQKPLTAEEIELANELFECTDGDGVFDSNAAIQIVNSYTAHQLRQELELQDIYAAAAIEMQKEEIKELKKELEQVKAQRKKAVELAEKAAELAEFFKKLGGWTVKIEKEYNQLISSINNKRDETK